MPVADKKRAVNLVIFIAVTMEGAKRLKKATR
jgi:hypothetical protein